MHITVPEPVRKNHFSETADRPPETPLISVAIPTFRRPDTLLRAIESVWSQDFSRWEIVVSDDIQEDGGIPQAVLAAARGDARIRLLKNNRTRGQVGNTNNAMLACSARWIKLLHDDDWLVPGALRKLHDAAVTFPSAACIACAAHLARDGGRIRRFRPRHAPPTVLRGEAWVKDLYLNGISRSIRIAPSNVLINSRVVQAGCLLRTWGAVVDAIDQLLFLDIGRHGDIVILDEALVYYDMTTHSSLTQSKKHGDTDDETLELKRYTWGMLADKRGLPEPERLVRALRLARVRYRYRSQSFTKSIADIANILKPGVFTLAGQALWSRL